MSRIRIFFSRRWHWVLFSVLIAALYGYSRAGELIFFSPIGEHNWANCDRASVAWNYFHNKASFLEPQTNNIAGNPSSIAAGEFPAHPWLAAQLYRLFGFHEYWYRLLTLAFSLAGYFFAFALCDRLIRRKVLVLAAACIWPCSTYLVYYSTGFLPDNVSLSLLIAGFFFAARDYPGIGKRNFAGFAACSFFALLLKTSAFFLYVPAACGLLIMAFRNEKNIRPLLRPALYLAVPPAGMAAWLMYAKHLQEKYHSAIFLLKGKSPASSEEYRKLLSDFFNRSEFFYNDLLVWLMAAGLVAVFFLRKRIPLFLLVSSLLGILSWFVFFWILARNASYHSYYHVPFHFVIFVFLLGIFIALDSFDQGKKQSAVVLTAVLFVFLFSVQEIRDRLHPVAFGLQLEKADWYAMENELDKLHVPQDAKIFSCEDPSPNISLYLMKRKGWTSLSHFWNSYKTEALSDCDYAVLSDTAITQDSACAPYFEKKIGSFRSLSIWKLR